MVTYKIIGVQNINPIEIEKEDDLTLEDFYKDMESHGVNIPRENLIFLTDNERVKDPEKKYDKDNIVLIYSDVQQYRDELKKIFGSKSITDESQKSQIVQNTLTPIEEEKYEYKDELHKVKECDINNKETLEILNNPDFINLLRIYKTKPEMLSYLHQYVHSSSFINVVNYDEIEVKEHNYNVDEIESMLKNYNLNITKEVIEKLLYHFKGNVSLTFRYIISSKDFISQDNT
jgi:hypothetical protein